MPLPDMLAKPIFHLIYPINRRMEGTKVAPFHRLEEYASRRGIFHTWIKSSFRFER